MNYFKVLLFLEKGNRDLFTYPKEEQIKFLEHLGGVGDDIDRAYKQYLCQNQLVRPKWKIALFNFIGAFAVPLTLLFLSLKRIFIRHGSSIDCLIEQKGMPEVVPVIVRERYHPSECYEKGSSIGLDDFSFVWQLTKKALWQPFFVFKALMNVAQYSHLIYKYSPSVMIQFGEFSFSGTVLTEYCHRHHVKHIDVMHGEKLFYIRDAFFHFDETYVWDQHYVDLLTSLRAESTQFRIAIPPSMCIDTVKYKNPHVYADYKYYLANFSEEELKSIVASMAFVKLEGKTVKYRPHPRYSDFSLLKKYVSEEEIEMPQQIGILASVSNLEYAVGSYTTVLTQAFFSGKKVLLDDVTFKDQYDKLKERRYILAEKSPQRLSDKQIESDD